MRNFREDFPLLQNREVVFLDSAASAQKPKPVIEAMVDVMERHYANVNRGVYTLSEEVTVLVEESRATVQKFINATQPEEIIFTRNTTESINLIMYTWARKNFVKGDIVVITEMEHHSNIVPWQMLRDEIGVELVWIPVNDEGYLAWEEFKTRDTSRIKLICVTHVSNVLGTINPIKEIASWTHAIGAKILVDGAQGVTNIPVDVQDLDVDWYAFSGHKLYGPSGVGVLYGKTDLLGEMQPFLGGGDMILEVTKEKTTYKEPPHKFEAGTPAIVEIIGLGAAIDYVLAIGMDVIREHNLELTTYAIGKLNHIEGVKLYGPSKVEHKGGVIAFSMEGIHPHDIATILNENSIAIRSGHHCAQPLCDRMGQSALARVSFGIYNTKEEIDLLITGLQQVRSVFKL